MNDHEKADLKIENKRYLENIVELKKDKSALIKLCIAEIITIVILDLIILKLVILL